MENRLKQIRERLELSQESFGNRIKIKRSHVSSLENGTRNITERLITDICREFNVNENWLRTGQEPMFSEQAISLDEFARQNDLDELETEIIKVVMSIPKSERKKIIDQMRKILLKGEEVIIGETEQAADVEVLRVKSKKPWELETDVVQAALDRQKEMDANYNNPSKKGKLSS